MAESKVKTKRHFIRHIFNVRAWLDAVRVQGWAIYFIQGAKRLFIPQAPDSGETFDAAIKRMKLSNDDLQAREQSLLRLCYFMLFIALLIGAYSIYHLFSLYFMPFLVSFAMMLIPIVLAFRYHFWAFQIRQRKLGCRIDEWYQATFKGGRS